jgi:hypothetical protein
VIRGWAVPLALALAQALAQAQAQASPMARTAIMVLIRKGVDQNDSPD